MVRSLDEFDRMTLWEYDLRLKALKLANVDRDHDRHALAFLSFQVQAMKPAGNGKQKPVYRTFKKFYDYEKELDKAGTERRSRFEGVGKVFEK